jgi:hypothetical protein
MTRATILSLLLLPTLAWADPGWEELYTKDGIVTSRRDVPDTKLKGFRGEGVVEVPLARLATVLLHDPIATEWVDMLMSAVQIAQPSADVSVVYQVYDLPWPVDDRDYVFTRTVRYDDAAKVMIAEFASTEHPSRPESDCCVRAQLVRTWWRFTKVDATHTKVEVEVLTDPKGSLPEWLVNLIQRGWPYETVMGIAKRAMAADIKAHPRVAGW